MLWFFRVGHFWLFSIGMVDQRQTAVIHAHGMVAHVSSNVMVDKLSKLIDFKSVESIQFVPGGRIRVAFSSCDLRDAFIAQKVIIIDNHHLDITESDAPLTSIYLHYLPYEATENVVRDALRPYGKVVDIRHQNFSGCRNIHTGTCIVRMALGNHHIPFDLSIKSFPCCVWYKGQPITCNICKGSHKAADCPLKDKCRRCHQAGHFARNKKNAWAAPPQNRTVPVAPVVPPVTPPVPPSGASAEAGSVLPPTAPAVRPRSTLPSLMSLVTPRRPVVPETPVVPPVSQELSSQSSETPMEYISSENIARFSDTGPSLPPSSPSISSFPSSCSSSDPSQSILREHAASKTSPAQTGRVGGLMRSALNGLRNISKGPNVALDNSSNTPKTSNDPNVVAQVASSPKQLFLSCQMVGGWQGPYKEVNNRVLR